MERNINMKLLKKTSAVLAALLISVSAFSFVANTEISQTVAAVETETEPTDPTEEPGLYESQYEIVINSFPEKVSYELEDKLDLTGLEVSLKLYNQNGEEEVICECVDPQKKTDIFVVDTSEFKNTKAGTYAIKISCTDDYQAFLPTEPITFDVNVKNPVEEYSAFEAVKIRRSLMADDGAYSLKNYNHVAKFLVNNSVLSIRKFILSYDTEDCDLSSYLDPKVLDPQEVIYKSSVRVVVANLVKDGYVNTGWEYDGKTYASGDLFKMPACDVVLKPVWCRRCKMLYTAGDYDDIKGNSSFYVMSSEGASYFLPDSSRFSRPGYVITGWLSEYDGKTYAPGAGITVPPADMNFEAIWSPAEYNVNISANNGNSADKLTMKARYTEDFVLPECEFTYEGKTFAGWKYNGSIYQPGESFPVPALTSGGKIVIVATWK